METDHKQRLSAGEQDDLHCSICRPLQYSAESNSTVIITDVLLNQSNSLQKCQAKPTAVKDIIEGRMKEYQARMQR